MSAYSLLIIVGLVLLVAWLLKRTPHRPTAQAPAKREPSTEPPDEVGVIEIEDAIDLHGFQPREIPSVVESYLEEAVKRGYREVRLIHGKGKGVQRQRVQDLLARHPDVESFVDAPMHRGGWGATIARLKTSKRHAR